jgi:acetyl-CoA synthetase
MVEETDSDGEVVMRERGRMSYADAYAGFRLADVEARLHGNAAGGLNACVACCDRHVGAGGIALEWENAAGDRESYSFADMQALSARFAGMLTDQGIGPGDVVAGLLPRIPDLVVTILGTWRAGAVYQPLFTAFGPAAIAHRLQTSGAGLVVTDAANRAKLDALAVAPRIAVARGGARPGDLDLSAELARHPAEFAPVLRGPDDLMMLMSTSGTTGNPKGVPVPLKALAAFEVYMRTAIDLRPEDRFWNIADPGWAYGLYYTITGPLLLGHATTLYDGPFTVDSTWRIIRSHGITNLAGAPTAYRLMIAAGAGAAAGLAGQLRAVSSAGEPLNPEVIRWFAEHLGVPIHDHYGQTELGMVVNNHHGLDHPVRPGTAGVPMPGYRIAVLGPEGQELPPGVPGVLAVDIANSPLLWFPGYLGQPEKSIMNGYYLTGDTVELEPSGHISFVGRNDDVITSSGYRIGPFEVESALIEHPAVAESAVIGKPDPERTEIVKAFVVLKAGHAASDDLAEALAQHVKRRLSAHAYPREVVFVTELPKTPSGKIQRFLLRNAEKG